MITLKPQHQATILGQFLTVSSQIKYHNENTAPFYSEMEEWEAKEYKSVLASNMKDLAEMKEYIMEGEAVFNNILSEYGLSVAVFISKYSA